MRLIVALLSACALAGAGVAQAGVRMHLPHKHRRPHDDGRTTADPPPVSDIPEPVWTPKPRG